jgi:hypothetical protein
MSHAAVQSPQATPREHARPDRSGPAREEETTLSLPTSIMTDRRVRLPLAAGALMVIGAAFRLMVVNATFLTLGLSGLATQGPDAPAIADTGSLIADQAGLVDTSDDTDTGLSIARFPGGSADAARPAPAMFDPLAMTLRPASFEFSATESATGPTNAATRGLLIGRRVEGRKTATFPVRLETIEDAGSVGTSRSTDSVELWYDRCTPFTAG